MAFTELYVRSDANGSGDGTTDTNSGANGAFTWAQMIADINTPRVGYSYNVKAGNYSLSSTTTLTGDGTTTSPNRIRGFSSVIGDATLGRLASGPLDVSNMPLITFGSGFQFVASGANYLILEALRFAGNTANSLVLNSGTGSLTFNCEITNSTTGTGDSLETGGSAPAIGNDVYLLNGSGTGAEAISSLGIVIGNRVILGANGTGINLRNNANLIAFNTVKGGNIGINKNTSTAQLLCMFNTLVGASGDGIYFPSASTARVLIVGNHITGCGGYGIDLGGSTIDKILYANRLRNNTAGDINGADDWTLATNVLGITDAASDSDDFTNPGSDDFSLKATADAFQKALFLQLTNIGANGSPLGSSEYSFISIG